jgi:hypothetical protein
MSVERRSRHLSPRQLGALDRVGDCLVPGDEDLPSFSRTCCVEHVDRILDYLPPEDRKDLGRVLHVLAFTPPFAIRWLLAFLETDPRLPDPVAAPLRHLRSGLRGLVFSLYYSGETGLHCTGKSPL